MVITYTNIFHSEALKQNIAIYPNCDIWFEKKKYHLATLVPTIQRPGKASFGNF
jgi:hypothetical protein